MSTPDIISVMQDEMLGDDTNQSAELIRTYNNADDAGKALIDGALICICGWSMESLRKMATDAGQYVED